MVQAMVNWWHNVSKLTKLDFGDVRKVFVANGGFVNCNDEQGITGACHMDGAKVDDIQTSIPSIFLSDYTMVTYKHSITVPAEKILIQDTQGCW